MSIVEFPFRFSFEQACRQAEDLQRALRANAPAAIARLQALHPEGPGARPAKLADAQLVVAREHGFESWSRLKAYAQPQVLYQNEMITEGKNDVIQGHWEDQVEMLHELVVEALAACGLQARHLARAGHMGNFGYSDYGLAAVTVDGQPPSHLVTVHYTYDGVFPFDEMHRQVASMCAWLHAMDRDTSLVIQAPVPDTQGALCQRIDHRPDGPAAVCTVQRWTPGQDIIGPERWEGWDAKGDASIDLSPESVRQMGSVLGQVHTHGQQWSRPDGFNRMQVDWKEDLSELDVRFWRTGERDPAEQDLVRRTLEVITQTRKEKGEPWGLTHGDFRVSNCLADGEQVHVIDFDLSSLSYQFDDIGWFLVDFARSELRDAFLKGYREASAPIESFVRLVEGALIAARVRRCAWGGQYPAPLLDECQSYLRQESFLLD